MAQFTIRPVRDAEALRRFVGLQAEIWEMDEAEAVPHHQLVAAVSAGGLVLGAFDGDGRLAGFSYAFPGWRRGTPFLYSHMTGVLAPYRRAGLGFRLKCAQRDAALAAGIDRIVWTYDPLQAGNARFNLGRLGVVAARYHPDYYGEMTDGINRGLPSDRFEVDWLLRSRRVEGRLTGAAAPAPIDGEGPWALEGRASDDGPAAPPGPPRLDLSAGQVLVQIPRDLAAVKAADPAAALAWRRATRTVFQHFFSQGYQAVEAGYVAGSGDRRVAYLLERGAAKRGHRREALASLPLRPYDFTRLPVRGAGR
jgi:predicted GNAT superfamily acetyltransferase